MQSTFDNIKSYNVSTKVTVSCYCDIISIFKFLH